MGLEAGVVEGIQLGAKVVNSPDDEMVRVRVTVRGRVRVG